MRVKIIISAVVLYMAFVTGFYFVGSNRSASSPNITGLLWPDPPKLEAFSLIDAQGNAFTEQELHGRWTLVFFGFTNCPAICPTAMATLNEVYNQVQMNNEVLEKIQVLFVSVDPERDKAEKLESYIGYFNNDFIGATANKESLEQFTRQFGIAYIKVKVPGSADYSVDHTASILLVDPMLRFVGIFSRPHEATDITDRLVQIASFVASNG